MSKLTVFCHVFSFLKSTASRPEVSTLVNQNGNTNSCSSHSSSSLLFEVKPAESVNIFPLETVRQRDEKMPAVCLKEEVVVCMSCLVPGFLKVSTVGCSSYSLSPIIWPVKEMD